VKLVFWILPIALLGSCASANGEGQAYQDGMGPLTDAANLGQGKWMITCAAALSACTWRAQQVCPTGFEAVDTSSSQSTSGAIGPYGGGFGTQVTHRLAINCRT